MNKNVKAYVGIDSQFRKEDGTQMTHDEMYTKVVEGVGLDRCLEFMPVSQDDLKAAFDKDKNLNTIPLAKWDRMHPVFKHQLIRIGITNLALSDTVCTLKHAARMWLEQDEN